MPVKHRHTVALRQGSMKAVLVLHLFLTGIDYRPSIGPHYRSHKGFPTGVVMIALVGATSQEHRPPISGQILNQIGMAGAGDGPFPVGIEVHLGEDGIVLPGFIGTLNGFATKYDLTVVHTGAALGSRQVVQTVDLVNMGSLNPNGLLTDVHATVNQDKRFLALHFAGLQIELEHPNGPMSFVQRRIVWRLAVVNQIHLSVLVKKQGGIDARDFGEENGIGPRTRRILRSDHIITSAPHLGAGHIIGAFMVFNGGRKSDLITQSQSLELYLLGTVQHVSDLLPGDQIGTVENGNSGKVAKGGVNHIIAVIPFCNAGIRVKPWQNGIVDHPTFEATVTGMNAASGQKNKGRQTKSEDVFFEHKHLISNCDVSYRTAAFSAHPNREWAVPIQREWASPSRSESKVPGHRATKWLHGSAL